SPLHGRARGPVARPAGRTRSGTSGARGGGRTTCRRAATRRTQRERRRPRDRRGGPARRRNASAAAIPTGPSTTPPPLRLPPRAAAALNDHPCGGAGRRSFHVMSLDPAVAHAHDAVTGLRDVVVVRHEW